MRVTRKAPVLYPKAEMLVEWYEACGSDLENQIHIVYCDCEVGEHSGHKPNACVTLVARMNDLKSYEVDE